MNEYAHLKSIERTLEDLADIFSKLAADIPSLQQQLASGCRPDIGIAHRIIEAATRFDEVAREGQTAIRGGTGHTFPLTIDALRSTLAQTRSSHEEAAQARTIISLLESLQYVGSNEADPFAPYRSELQQVARECESLEPSNPVRSALARGSHRFAQLAARIQAGGSFDNPDWVKDVTNLASSFDGELCVAVLRGELVPASPAGAAEGAPSDAKPNALPSKDLVAETRAEPKPVEDTKRRGTPSELDQPPTPLASTPAGIDVLESGGLVGPVPYTRSLGDLDIGASPIPSTASRPAKKPWSTDLPHPNSPSPLPLIEPAAALAPKTRRSMGVDGRSTNTPIVAPTTPRSNSIPTAAPVAPATGAIDELDIDAAVFGSAASDLPADPAAADTVDQRSKELEPPVDPVVTTFGAVARSGLPATAMTTETGASGIDVESATPQALPPIQPGDPALALLESNSTCTLAGFLARQIQPDRAVLARLVWMLLAEDRIDVAYHVAKQSESPDAPSPHLIRSVLLARAIRYATGEVANELQPDVEAVLSELGTVPGPTKRAHGLLAVAAALRPALLAPMTGAAQLLDAARDQLQGMDALYEYAGVIVRFATRSGPLDATVIKGVRDSAAVQRDLDQLKAEVRIHLEAAGHARMVYAGASDVLRSWHAPDGTLGKLLDPVVRDDIRGLPWVTEEIGRLSARNVLRQEVDAADRRSAALRRREPINYDALAQLGRNLNNAIDFARRWADLHASAGRVGRGDRTEQADRLRQEVSRWQARAEHELGALASAEGPDEARIAASLCQRAVRDVRTLFDPDAPLPDGERQPGEVVDAILLRLGARFTGELPALTDLLAGLAADHSWEEAFIRCLEVRHLAGAQAILELATARTEEFVGLEMENLHDLRQRRLRECRAALQDDVLATLRDIEGAVSLGLLGEELRAALIDRVERVRAGIEECADFAPEHNSLGELRGEIEKRRRQEVDAVRARMTNEELAHALDGRPDARSRIDELLSRGDAATATEYLDLVLRAEDLPAPKENRNPFIEFMGRFGEIERFLNDGPARPVWRQVVDTLKTGKMPGPVSARDVPQGRLRQAADMADLWTEIKFTDTAVRESQVRRLLEYFGLTNVAVTMQKQGQRQWAEVQADPISDRGRVPVHAYGSTANGRYRVLLLRQQRITEEDVLSAVGETAHRDPVIVLYFNTFTAMRRRDLGRLSRERRRTFVVVDDLLLFYLCGERGTRLPVLFRCALPFTWANPYTTTAGFVPPEVFYGRRSARASLEDPLGSCFVYGGRQLGKTALLRDVERNFHDPGSGRIAVWLDLQAAGIGLDRDITEVWPLIGERFKQLGVLPPAFQPSNDPIRLIERTREWLDGDQRRRMLLLLDEADQFLSSDARDGSFKHIRAFKDLMDSTKRRFKVVFTGLHNVQRTVRGTNQPLAHYGEPISIGPLLEDGEWKEASALIEEPLGAIGYRFESSDVATRILSRTNYFPALIQLYCTDLLDHLVRARARATDRDVFTVTARHVDDVYRDKELRRKIGDKFMLTLRLDERYHVIALAIALESGGPITHDGFTAGWIREQALLFWPQGFADSSAPDTFRELLEEMVGLGMLRHSAGGRYALRSPNVMSLLGTRAQIEEVLEACSTYEAPATYEASQFRASVRTAETVRRSPLTARQVADLRRRENGATILTGCVAAGLPSVRDALADACGQDYFVGPSTLASIADLNDVLDGLSAKDRAAGGTTIVLVDHQTPWGIDWIAHARSRLRSFRSRSSFVRLAFVAEPRTVWAMLGFDAGSALLNGEEIDVTALTPWHDSVLRLWFQDLAFGPSSPEGRSQVRVGTGNWPVLLERWHQRAGSGGTHWDDALRAFATDVRGEGHSEIISALGLDLPEPKAVLETLAALGSAPLGALVELLDGEIAADQVERALRWAELLALASSSARDLWTVEPFMQSLLIPSRTA